MKSKVTRVTLQYVSTAACTISLLIMTSCSSHLATLPASHIEESSGSQVESVLFTMGDAGDAQDDADPVMRAMQADVERWSGALARDSSVVVVFLGDNIYPGGLHDRTDPLFNADSSALQAQIDVVNGPNARKRGARAIFIAGNHDWGQTKGLDGLDRLKNQEEMLARRRAEGAPVWLMPKAGTPGPESVDIGTRLRILLMDSAWWLLSGNDTSKTVVYRNMKRLVDGAGERNVVVAAHHPFRSASSHGGLMPFWSGLGVRYLLNRSGAVLQDLSSIPYRSLTQALEAAFADHPPLLFVGGHDHNLQIIQGQGGPEPKWMLVSGAGSKSDKVGEVKGMQFRKMGAGYMRTMFNRDGTVDVFVIAAGDETPPTCHGLGAEEREKCMASNATKYTDVYSRRIK